jgi:membrane protease YdiL (CAAX protease family)
MDWVFAVALLTFLAVEPWVGVAFYKRMKKAGPSERPGLYLTMIGFGGLFVVLALGYAACTGRLTQVLPLVGGAPRLDWLGPKVSAHLVEIMPGIIGGMMVGALGGFVMAIVPKLAARMAQMGGDFEAFFPRSGQERWLCAGIALSAGISEELAFRGALLDILQRLVPHGSMALAVGLAVVLFGLAHAYQGVRGVLGTTVAGAALMALYLGTGSLIPGIVVHFLIDLKLAAVRLPSPARPLAA